MLATIGLKEQSDLLAYIPDELRFDENLAIPNGRSEFEIVDYFKARGDENALGYASFLGAGVYQHYRPLLIPSSRAASSLPLTRRTRPRSPKEL